jgi:hypothetical protein
MSIILLSKHNPEQFEIIYINGYAADGSKEKKELYVGGKEKYKRILIRRRTE